jgi:hypothetical protein
VSVVKFNSLGDFIPGALFVLSSRWGDLDPAYNRLDHGLTYDVGYGIE